MRPRTLKAAKRRAWEAISKWVRSTAADSNGYAECVTCQTRKPWKELDCGHYQHGLTVARFPDGKPYVVIENLHPQCRACNGYKGGMLDLYTLYMIDMYGRKFVEELQAMRHEPCKMSIDDWWAIEQEYREAS